MAILDEITAGYIDAALWADCERLCTCEQIVPGSSALGEGHVNRCDAAETGNMHGTLDVSPEQRAKLAGMIDTWRDSLPDGLEDTYRDELGDGPDYTWSERFGHDLRLTAGGHGAGFWDRGLPDDIGNALSDAARMFGDHHVYQVDETTARFDI